MKNTIIICCFPALVCLAESTTKIFADAPLWDVQSDTWTATDDLKRTLPDAATAGPPKQDKFIGMFYFLWLGRHGEQGPFDISKILAADSEAIQKENSPLWGPPYVPHHWGESVFDYYVSDDEFVLRKHAQMLADAGVDVIIFDVTNQVTYPESYKPLSVITTLDWEALPKQFLFKWADGIKLNGEWSDFTLHGDVAPNDRYNYKAVLR
jgi:hypothetical protein